MCENLQTAVRFVSFLRLPACGGIASCLLASCMFPCKVCWENVHSQHGLSQPHKSLCCVYSFFFFFFFQFSLVLSPKCNLSLGTESQPDQIVVFLKGLSQMFSRTIFFALSYLKKKKNPHKEPLTLYEKYIFMFKLLFPVCHVTALLQRLCRKSESC